MNPLPAKNQLNKAVELFLQSGLTDLVAPAQLAEECNRLVRLKTQKSTKAGLELARSFVKRAGGGDVVLEQTANRALGWALHVGGEYAAARDAYLKARYLVRLKDPIVRGRIDRILIDVFMYLGDNKEATRRSKLAISTFKKLNNPAEVAKTRVNYANLFHRQDRHQDAGRQYQQAMSFFEKNTDDLTLALCCYNYANTLVQLFDFDKAGELYNKAGTIFGELDYDLYRNEARYGSAWLLMLEGNFHQALEELATCEQTYRSARQPRGVVLCQLDQSEAFLGLNLLVDARDIARQAEKKAGKLGIHYEAAKAAFFMAKASIALGRKSEALSALKRAEFGFTKEKNTAFLAAVKLLGSQISNGNGDRSVQLESARRSFSRSQLPLWEGVCDLEALAQDNGDKSALKRLAHNPAVHTVPHLYALWQTLKGDFEAAKGHRKAALDHWRNAAEMLDSVRAKLPPIEMRTTYLRQACQPHLRLITSEALFNPAWASAWAERYKTAGIWSTLTPEALAGPVREKVLDSLGALADRVTALSGRLDVSSGNRTSGAAVANPGLIRLQREARRSLAAAERQHSNRTIRLEKMIERIAEISRKMPVVQYQFDQTGLLAFVHHEGEVRAHRFALGNHAIDDLIDAWRLVLCRSISRGHRNSKTQVAEERELLSAIAGQIWYPLQIPTGPGQVLVIPDGRLANLPWSAITFDGLSTGNKQNIIMAPSIQHYEHATRQKIDSDKCEVFIGSTAGLTDYKAEIEILTELSPGKVTIHPDSVRSDWPTSGESLIWHYVGHAKLRRDNPFYSSIELADGPLFAADFRLKNNRVGLINLAACRTGEQAVLPGEESSGLVRALLEMGAANVIASHWAVSDRSTSLWMSTFYRNLFTGQSLADSMSTAMMTVKNKYSSAYHWAAFSLFGAGNFTDNKHTGDNSYVG